jgi:hypothetical protein
MRWTIRTPFPTLLLHYSRPVIFVIKNLDLNTLILSHGEGYGMLCVYLECSELYGDRIKH